MAHSPWNKSHYYDPTAKAALDRIDKKKQKIKSQRNQSVTKSINRIEDQLDGYMKNKLRLIAEGKELNPNE